LIAEVYLAGMNTRRARRALARLFEGHVGKRRWRCRHGWRSFLHGVGSFSILPIGTYAASSNFHQPRDTTVYWTVNLCKPDLTKKARNADVEWLLGIWADLEPIRGARAAGRARSAFSV
jgi:hypothetical protein